MPLKTSWVRISMAAQTQSKKRGPG
jgi:hypothetical protein